MIISCHKEDPSPVIYQTNFDSGSQWPQKTGGSEILMWVQDHYEISLGEAGGFLWAYVPCGTINTNYSIAFDGSILLDDPSRFGYLGVVFNFVNTDNYEMFRISSRGYFEVVKKTLGKFETLSDWTFSAAINTNSGSKNRLELDQKQNSIEIIVNDQNLGSFPYPRAADVKIGIATGTTSVPDFTTTTGSFDNLIVAKLP